MLGFSTSQNDTEKKDGSIKQRSVAGTVNTVFYIEAAIVSMALRQQDDISLPIRLVLCAGLCAVVLYNTGSFEVVKVSLL